MIVYKLLRITKLPNLSFWGSEATEESLAHARYLACARDPSLRSGWQNWTFRNSKKL